MSDHTATAMTEAFAAAGYKPPPERLMQCAFDAWTKYPGFQGAGARRDHIAALLRDLWAEWRRATKPPSVAEA